MNPSKNDNTNNGRSAGPSPPSNSAQMKAAQKNLNNATKQDQTSSSRDHFQGGSAIAQARSSLLDTSAQLQNCSLVLPVEDSEEKVVGLFYPLLFGGDVVKFSCFGRQFAFGIEECNDNNNNNNNNNDVLLEDFASAQPADNTNNQDDAAAAAAARRDENEDGTNNDDDNDTHNDENEKKINKGFCKWLLESIIKTGFLHDDEVEEGVKQLMVKTCSDNEQIKIQIKTCSDNIIANSHFFFLAVVSVNPNMFTPRIFDVFSKLDIFSDSRVSVVAHLLQGRNAFFHQADSMLHHQILGQSNIKHPLNIFCSKLNDQQKEPKVFFPSAKLLDIKRTFDNTIPKQLAVALVAKQFVLPNVAEMGRNALEFTRRINAWLDAETMPAAVLASEANNSAEIYKVIKNPRVISMRDAVGNRWSNLKESPDMVFIHDLSKTHGSYAMAASDATCKILNSRHVPMYAVDTFSLEFPAAASFSSGGVKDENIYIVPGSSGLGKTTACACYEPTAPRIFIDSAEEMKSGDNRQVIESLTRLLGEAEKCEGGQSAADGAPRALALSSAQLRGIRNGYASLVFIQACLRAFYNNKDRRTTEFFAGCVKLPIFPLLASTQATATSVKNIKDAVERQRLVLASTMDGVYRAMLDLFLSEGSIHLYLGLNEDFGGILVLILDEIGACPELMRGLSSGWNILLERLKSLFRMKSTTSKIIFLAAGTGSQRTASTLYGSRMHETGPLRFCTVHPNRVFLTVLSHFKNEKGPRKIFAITLFDLLFEPQNVLGANLRLKNDSPNSSEIQFGDNKYKIRSKITAAQFRYVQMTINNARCAGIAAFIVHNFFASLPAEGPNFTWSAAAISSLLPGWSSMVASFYPQLNGLSKLSLQEKLHWVSAALLISMTNQLTIGETCELYLCVSLGILDDSARWIDSDEVRRNPGKYHVIEVDERTGTSLVCSINKPRYRISEAFIAFFLTQFGDCLAGSSASVGYAGWELFEQCAADYQLICLILNCAQHIDAHEKDNDRRLAWIGKLPPICRLFVHHNIRIEGSVCYRKLSNWLARDSNQIPAKEFEFWKEEVGKSGAIVLINGACAPFADIVVITKKVIFLTQCKYLSSPKSKYNPEKEFRKMHGSAQNKRTRELLMWCCGSRDVTFVCIVLTKTEKPVTYRCKSGTNADEKFTYEEHIIAAFQATAISAPAGEGVINEKQDGTGKAPTATSVTTATTDTKNNNNNNSTKNDENSSMVLRGPRDVEDDNANTDASSDSEIDDAPANSSNDISRALASTMFPVLSARWPINETSQNETVEARYAKYRPVEVAKPVVVQIRQRAKNN